MPFTYRNAIQSMSAAEISRPKSLLRTLFCLNRSEIKGYPESSFWSDKSNYIWLTGNLLKTLTPTETDDETDECNLSTFIQMLNDDGRVEMLLADNNISALLSAFFSYYPEYVLQLRSYDFICSLSLDFDWVNGCVSGLINHYFKQIHNGDFRIRETACYALGSAAVLLTGDQLAIVIKEMLFLSVLPEEKACVKIAAYKTLAATTCYLEENEKAHIINELTNRANHSDHMVQHYSILEALGIIANTASSAQKLEVTNLFTYLCYNGNRELRKAANLAKNSLYPQVEAKSSESKRLGIPAVNLSQLESEAIQRQAITMQYPKRISIIRKIALNHHDGCTPLNFDALVYIFNLNEMQRNLQECEAQAFNAPITQLIAEYCAKTKSI